MKIASVLNLSIFGLLCFVNISAGQTISISDVDGINATCTGDPFDQLSFAGSDGGTPARNIYTGISGNGGFVWRVIFANNRWEVQADLDAPADGVYEALIWWNEFASAPNPPSLGTGTWVESGFGCNDLMQFTGTGTQTNSGYYSFKGPGTNWSTASNWSTGIVPTSGGLINGEIVAIDANCTLSGVNISFANGTELLVDGGILTLNSGSVVSIQAGATLTNSATITDGSGNGRISNAGTFDNIGTFNSKASSNTGTFNNNGGVLVTTGGSFTLSNGSFNQNGIFAIEAGGTLSKTGGTFNNNGSLVNDGSISGGGSFSNNFSYSGTGNYSGNTFTNSNNGFVFPGSSPGCLSFSNGFSNNGTLDFEINGATQCTDYDRINVTGAAVLGGTLNVTWGFTPTAGQTFTIMTFGSRTGIFSSVNIPSVGGLNFTVSYTSTAVTLSAPSLPVELMDFSAKSRLDKVELLWQTASEQNNQGFYIERMAGENDRWDELGFVAGHGTTTGQQYYTFLDEKPLPGNIYYRLRQVDQDGRFEYSPVANVSVAGKGITAGEFFPNPAKGGQVNLNFTANEAGDWKLSVFDAIGKKCSDIQSPSIFSVEQGSNLLHFDFSGLRTGIYFVKLESGTERVYRKLVIE